MFDMKEFHPCGIVKRVDELGRVVIPRELRNSAGIKEGDSFEIYSEDKTGRLLLIPYKEKDVK